MKAVEKIKAENTKNLVALIKGDIERTTVAGVNVCRIDVFNTRFYFESGNLRVFGDELEVDGDSVYLIQGDTYMSMVPIWRE